MGIWFSTRVPGQFNGIRRVSSGNGADRTGCSYAKEWSCTHTSHYIKKMSSYRIKDINIRMKTIQFLGENAGLNHWDLGSDSGFLDMTPKA